MTAATCRRTTRDRSLPRGRRAFRATAAALALAGVLTAAGCSSAPATDTSGSPSSQPSSPVSDSGPATRSPATAAGEVAKLLVVVVENHSLGQMRSGMPFVRGLATDYGYATDYRALTHPSLPNYLAIVGGDTFGVGDDDPPEAHPLRGPSVFGEAVRSGETAALYADGMDRQCQPDDGGDGYAVRHNPWTYFTDEHALCESHDLPLDAFDRDVADGQLPTVGMLVPDVCNDAHDCSLAQADGWIEDRVSEVMAGPDWASGRLAVVVTADEDDNHHGNRVLTVVAHPDLHGDRVRAPLTHYSLSRAYAEVAGVRPLRRASTARSLLDAFGLTPAR